MKKTAKIEEAARNIKKIHLKFQHGLNIEKKTTYRDKANNKNNISTKNILVQEGDKVVRCCPVILHTPQQML